MVDRVAVDLDALSGKSIIVKLRGEEVELEEPALEDLFDLIRLAKVAQDADLPTEAEGIEDLAAIENGFKIYEDFRSGVDKVFPVLVGKKINIRQLLKIVEIMQELAVPPELEELEKHNIKLTSDQKKTISATLKQ